MEENNINTFLMNKVAAVNHAIGRLNLVKYTYKYCIVNKPSGVQSDGNGNYNNFLIPQLTKIFQQLHPDKKIDWRQFQMVQRLDKYVTGGLIVSRDEKFTRLINKSLRSDPATSLKVTRRYVGLIKTEIPIDTLDKQGLRFTDWENGSGIITHEIQAVKDRTNHEIQTYDAETRFKILNALKMSPSKEQVRRYPKLYTANSIIYPAIFELRTGRKNQIRDNVLQAFDSPLLNDDNFKIFKFKSVKTNPFANVGVNSDAYKSNQIGLHSAYMQLSRDGRVIEEQIFPVFDKPDRELWKGFINEDTGEFVQNIQDELRHFESLD